MAFVASDWSITRSTKAIRYIGHDHNGASPSYATVIEFHRALQDFADDSEFSSDDELDITDPTPSERSTDNIVTLINGWNIDDNAAEHIYDGSIIQTNGDEIYDGLKILAPVGTMVQFIQNGAVLSDDWWNYSEGGTHTGSANAAVLTDSTKSWTVSQWVGYRIKNITDGSFAIITANTATTITGTLVGGSDNDWDASDAYLIIHGLNNDSVNGVSHNFMMKVRTGGVDIDGRRLLATTREWGKTYLEFKVNGTTRGNNVVALAAASDLNNSTALGTIAGLSSIANLTEGYVGIDVDANGANEFYYSKWDTNAQSINNFYQRMKWLSRDSSASTLYGLNGELFRGITHQITVDNPSATDFSAMEQIAWGIVLGSVVISGTGGQFTCANPTPFTISVGQVLRISGTFGGTGSITGYSDSTSYLVSATNGSTTFTLVTLARSAIVTTAGTPTGLTYELQSGTGQMLAINDVNAPTTMWLQLLTGVAPIDNHRVRGVTSGATADVNVTIVERTISTPFCGASTGSAIIGSYGFGIEAADLTSNDKLFDLTNTQLIPPNYVTFQVGGLVAGDRVMVTNNDGSAVDYNQFTLNGALTGAAVTSVVVNGSIPSDTPATGTIRILRNNGKYIKHAYTSWNGSTFTIGSTDFSSNNASNGNNVFISYIDDVAAGATISFTSVYLSDRSLFVRVRNGGGGTPIKSFETTGTLGSSGGTTTAIRTSDA